MMLSSLQGLGARAQGATKNLMRTATAFGVTLLLVLPIFAAGPGTALRQTLTIGVTEGREDGPLFFLSLVCFAFDIPAPDIYRW